MGDNAEVLLSILMDQAARSDVERGLDSIGKKVGDLDKSSTDAAKNTGNAWDEMSSDFEKFTKKFEDRFKLINGDLVDLQSGAKVAASTLRDFSGIDVNKQEESFKEVKKTVEEVAREIAGAKEAEKELNREMSHMARIAGISVEEVRELPESIYDSGRRAVELEQNFKKVRIETERLTRSAQSIQRFATPLLVGGTAIVGAIALSARNYSKFIEDAGIQGDETANRWVAASKKVQNAQLNLGQQSAQALLPVYEKLAELAEKAASFVNENPEVLQAALNIGVALATLGMIGLAVSKGIRLVADFKYLAATSEFTLATVNFDRSVKEFLAGSVLPKGSVPSTGAAGAGVAGKLGAVALYATAVIIGVEAGAAIGNALGKLVYGDNYRKQGLGDAALTATRISATPIALLAAELEKLGGTAGKVGDFLGDQITKNDQLIQKLLGVGNAADEANSALDGAETGLRDFAQEAALASATNSYIQFRQQEIAAEKQYFERRSSIVEQGAAQLVQIESNYAKQRTNLARQFARQSALALENFEYQQSQAAEQFARQQSQALEEYNLQRAETIANFQQEEQRAREDHLREMRKMEEDHDARIQDLAASRDALGIVRENRQFARQSREAEENYRVERQRSRQDLQKRLQDMEQNFRRERERQREEYEYQQAQAQEQFLRQQEQAKEQYEEQQKLLAEQHKQEIEQARRQTAERLAELQRQYREEQIQRRNSFYDILRDLDANLLNERETRVQYYQRMQDDLIAFLEETATAAGNYGSNLPGYQTGGYVPGGPIRSHPGEYMLNSSTVNFIEKSIGGRLTQQSILGLASGNSVRVSVGPITYDGKISAADRVEIARISEQAALFGTLKALKEA